MDKLQSLKFSLVSPVVAFVAISQPAYAQEEIDDLLPHAACFEKAGANGNVISVIAPKQAASAMRAKDFTRAPCRKSFETAALREAYRDGVCHMAATYRPDQIANFEELYGERPEVLCGLAEVAISQWRFRGRGQSN